MPHQHAAVHPQNCSCCARLWLIDRDSCVAQQGGVLKMALKKEMKRRGRSENDIDTGEEEDEDDV